MTMTVEEMNGDSDSSIGSTQFEEYSTRIARLQNEYLIPLKEDLADWLCRILDLEDITCENFMSKLDNGVIVCKLAKLIQERCDAKLHSDVNGALKGALDSDEGEIAPHAASAKRSQLNVMTARMKCWENAKSQSFYARDNVSNFLKWCRKFGVRDAVIFESDDLVSHVNPRNVVLCLLEVARIACTRHSFTPAPGLVEFEKEIDELDDDCTSECDGMSYAVSVSSIGIQHTPTRNGNHVGRAPSASSLLSNTSSSTNTSTPTKLTSVLDHKVMLIAKSYYGREVHQGVKRLSEGKYRIAGRIVFIRLLKERHVMVRVGGGWDTLQHFLERHGGDPTQEITPADLLPLDTRASSVTPRNRPHNLVNASSNGALSTIIPTFRRCASSTPVSRRSSLSSPEPWMSASSGYSSSSAGYSPPVDSSIIPKSIRRSSAEVPARRRSLHRGSISGIPLSSSTSFATPCASNNRPTSEPVKGRYPNYLSSSQHITNRSSNGIATISTPTINLSKSAFSKSVQKTC